MQRFKEETVALVTGQGYTVIEAAEAVGVRSNQIYNWKQRIVDEATGVNAFNLSFLDTSIMR